MEVTAKVTRTQGWWAIEVPEAPGVFTQAKRLDQVAAMVQDAISLMLDLEPTEIEVTVEPALSTDVDKHVRGAKRLMAQAHESQLEASMAARLVVRELREVEGLSVRDVAQLLELSPQRISQLTPSSSRASSFRASSSRPAAPR